MEIEITIDDRSSSTVTELGVLPQTHPSQVKGNPISPAATTEARELTRVLIQYRVPNLARSITELTITAGPLALLWFLMWATLDLGYWLSLLFAVPAAGFLVRLFMIQHDCGHGAFFHLRSTNDWVGRAIGVLTLTPYDFWRHTHAVSFSLKPSNYEQAPIFAPC